VQFRPSPQRKRIKNINNQENNQIRLIGEDGTQLGLTSFSDARNKAEESGLDLVVVSQNTNPQVYRLMDYGKYQYQQKKKEHKTREIKIKGVRIGFKTGENDLMVKRKRAEGFLKKGDKVRLEIFLRGREKAFQHDARKKLEEFVKSFEEPYKVEQYIKRSPRGFSMLISS